MAKSKVVIHYHSTGFRNHSYPLRLGYYDQSAAAPVVFDIDPSSFDLEGDRRQEHQQSIEYCGFDIEQAKAYGKNLRECADSVLQFFHGDHDVYFAGGFGQRMTQRLFDLAGMRDQTPEAPVIDALSLTKRLLEGRPGRKGLQQTADHLGMPYTPMNLGLQLQVLSAIAQSVQVLPEDVLALRPSQEEIV